MDKSNIDKVKSVLRGEKVKTTVGYEGLKGKKTDKPDGTKREVGNKTFIAANHEWHEWSPGKIIHYTDKDGNQKKVGKERAKYSMPWFCPECKKSMKERDRSYWYKDEMCMDCSMKKETKRRINNPNWRQEDYENRVQGIEAWAKEAREEIEEIAENLNNEHFVQQDGRLEKWSDQDPEEFKEKYLGYVEKERKQLLESAKEILVTDGSASDNDEEE